MAAGCGRAAIATAVVLLLLTAVANWEAAHTAAIRTFAREAVAAATFKTTVIGADDLRAQSPVQAGFTPPRENKDAIRSARTLRSNQQNQAVEVSDRSVQKAQAAAAVQHLQIKPAAPVLSTKTAGAGTPAVPERNGGTRSRNKTKVPAGQNLQVVHNATMPSSRSANGNPLAYADSRCHPTPHAGFNGGALGWGMSFKVSTAQECCDACRQCYRVPACTLSAHAKTCVPGAGGKVYMKRSWEGKVVEERCAQTMSSNEAGTAKAMPCNVFVFCPTPLRQGGLCWSNDVWNHTYGECWLKNQRDPSFPEAGAYGAYPDGYRKKHHTAPEKVQWMSGSLSGAPSIKIDGPKWHW